MGPAIRLGGRLLKIADMVKPGARIIDVGTDHAYLPAYLILSGKVQAAKASDIGIGPLRRAEQTRRRYYLEDRLELRLCPGLRDFAAADGDTVVIAGMGGETIAAILYKAQWVKDGFHRLLLQPMTSNEDLRGHLFSCGFQIKDEALSKERGKLYAILDVSAGGEAGEHPAYERHVSRHLLKDPLAGAYFETYLGRLRKRRDGLLRARAGTCGKDEIISLSDTIDQIAELKKEWERCRR